jgi:hypothetical protein
MNLENPSKALIALVGLICITVLLAVNSIPTEAGTGMLGTILGYAVGNGIAAKSGKPVTPIIGSKKVEE